MPMELLYPAPSMNAVKPTVFDHLRLLIVAGNERNFPGLADFMMPLSKEPNSAAIARTGGSQCPYKLLVLLQMILSLAVLTLCVSIFRTRPNLRIFFRDSISPADVADLDLRRVTPRSSLTREWL